MDKNLLQDIRQKATSTSESESSDSQDSSIKNDSQSIAPTESLFDIGLEKLIIHL